MMTPASTNTDDSQRYGYLGFGLGLRPQHYESVLALTPCVDWFEVLSENYLVPGGKPLYYLDQIRERYPLAMHGVSLSIGGSDALDVDYIKQLGRLAARIDASWISDHLCWTGIAGKNIHDLLPLPYTEEAVSHTAARVAQVQDMLGRRILLENVSSYLAYADSAMTEWEFLCAVVEKSDCLILLDINNIYVSAFNHGFDPLYYIDAIPPERVQQFHLAGHRNLGDHILDTHDAQIIDPVWRLYRKALTRFGRVSTMIERDDKIPPLEELMRELERAKFLARDVLGEEAA